MTQTQKNIALAFAIVAGLISLAIIVVLLSGKASLGIGSLLGLASAVIPVVCLVIPPSQRQATDSSDSDHTTAQNDRIE